MQRERQRTGAGRRLEHGDAVAAGRVHEQLAGAHRAGGGQTLDQTGQHVVGDGEQHELGLGEHVLGRHQRDPGQQRVGTAARGVGDTGGGDHVVPRGRERGAQDRPDPAGADDTDREPDGSGCGWYGVHGVPVPWWSTSGYRTITSLLRR